jgi:putative hemolysin
VQSETLSYSSPSDPLWKRWAMRAIEDLSGRRGLLPVYYRWRRDVAGKSPRMMGELLEMVGARIALDAPAWPPAVPADAPLVIVANHPFGIGDGIALLALAEQLGRPYRILINSDFMRVPEIRPVALPIDFSGTPAATDTNVRTRREARRLLRDGVTIVVFPAGGVATAEQPFGKAEDLPWKSFTARLVQLAQAAVLPVYFEGQNSALFHFVSRYSLSLRLALLVSEFRYCVGASIKTHVGDVVPFTALEARADRNLLTEELYARVHRLAPGAAERRPEELKARPAHARRQFPWDKPR